MQTSTSKNDNSVNYKLLDTVNTTRSLGISTFQTSLELTRALEGPLSYSMTAFNSTTGGALSFAVDIAEGKDADVALVRAGSGSATSIGITLIGEFIADAAITAFDLPPFFLTIRT
ncbi:MAG: hypothetical protein WCK67_13430 [bacterium]